MSDSKQARRDMDEVGSSADKLRDGFKAVETASRVGFAAFGLAAGNAVKDASNLEQSIGGMNAVFGAHSDQLAKLSKTAYRDLGLSQREFNESTTILGAQLKNLGLPMDQVTEQTVNLTRMGADLAATFGGTTSDAVAALSSLLRGERDPIERYGVSIKQADIEAKKAQLGLAGLTGEANRNAEVQATLALLTEQTASSVGMFASEADTAAGAWQRTRAQWENVSAELGTRLLPYIVKGAEVLIKFADWVQRNEQLAFNLAIAFGAITGAVSIIAPITSLVTALGAVGGALGVVGTGVFNFFGRFVGGMLNAKVAASSFSGVAGTLGGAVASVGKAIKAGAVATWGWVRAGAAWLTQASLQLARMAAQKVVTLALAAAKNVAAVAQRAWNLAMNANPIGLIITLVVTAVGLIIANWSKLEPYFTAAWNAIKQVATEVWGWITTQATTVWNWLKNIGEWIGNAFTAYWRFYGNIAVAAWNLIKGAATTVWNWLKNIGNSIGGFFSNVWNRVAAVARIGWNVAVSGAQWLLQRVQQVGAFISSFLSSAFNVMSRSATAAISGVISWVQSLFSWLQSAANFIGNIGSSVRGLLGFSAGLQYAPAFVTAAPALAPSAGPIKLPAKQAATVTNNITVNLPNYLGDKREIVEVLRYELEKLNRNRSGLIA
ncbi:hypothetical protein [Canibacter zhoujuaniae]|uniref:hypothetical protein n=1 Tax=Canibacter zhoujuaniae TaxID=2708343 RepID=UPI00141EA52A|nr:hypothetical protein [Canibacter zhoujuaniae]